jgi:hypothetical protein
VRSDTYSQFFTELKHYNSTNFKTLRTADLDGTIDTTIRKAFSSVITRYFILTDFYFYSSTNKIKRTDTTVSILFNQVGKDFQ